MFIPEIEKQSVKIIKEFQEAKLGEALNYVAANSPFYKKQFNEYGIKTHHIRVLEDLDQIPLTTKEDLQHFNDAFICVARNKVVDYVTTSGTLGDPVTFILTDKDLERLAYNEFLSFGTANGTKDDIYQLMTTIDRQFMAGLAYFLGVRKSGAGIIRTGPGIPELQWDIINRIKPTTLITVPSFLPKLIQYAIDHEIDFNRSSIEKAICIGEPIRNSDFSLNTLGRRIKENWDIQLFSTYASTEMATAFTECEAGIGCHHHPEMIIIEFLDEMNKPVKPGLPGEITITSLGVEGMPLIRFKTGDICEHFDEKCSCGRNTIRLGPILGRKKQMIKYKGTTLYPPALYDILDNVKNIVNYIVEINSNQFGTDEIIIRIGTDASNEWLEKEIKDHFRAKLRVTPSIVFEPVDIINKSIYLETGRKPVKFIDRR